MIKIKKGLDIPISGKPEQKIVEGNAIKSVALIGLDYIGMKPTMEVKIGDQVKLGQKIFLDKKTGGIIYTSPGSGKIIAINRGKKKAFQSIVIQLQGDEQKEFKSFSENALKKLTRKEIVENLTISGLWSSLKTRPYSKVPDPDTQPHSLFVTAMDSNPLAADPYVIISTEQKAFEIGLDILSNLTAGTTFLCKEAGKVLDWSGPINVQVEDFSGVHPAGIPGTHIHFLDPVSAKKTVWYINYQDVIAVGKLFTTGKLDVTRIVSLAGPRIKTPKLVKTRLGANLDELLQGEIKEGNNRIISGSVLSGRKSENAFNYLGKFHHQVSVIEEGTKRDFLGWLGPGFNIFSIKNIFFSKLIAKKSFNFTSSTGGSKRAMVPVGSYEAVMPLDIQPVFLLRSLILEDTDQAQALGCLELDEEDLSLCTFVCPGKHEYGSMLRNNLTTIEKEG